MLDFIIDSYYWIVSNWVEIILMYLILGVIFYLGLLIYNIINSYRNSFDKGENFDKDRFVNGLLNSEITDLDAPLIIIPLWMMMVVAMIIEGIKKFDYYSLNRKLSTKFILLIGNIIEKYHKKRNPQKYI